jgi:hypothetical protein
MNTRSLLMMVACGALFLNGQGPGCSLEQIPGAITSWSGQSTAKDHIDTQTLRAGTVLSCEATDAPGSPLPAGCNVSVEGGGRFMIPSHYVMRTPKDGAVTLSCNGPSPTCCRVQVKDDAAPLQRGDTKPHKQK